LLNKAEYIIQLLTTPATVHDFYFKLISISIIFLIACPIYIDNQHIK